MSLKNNIVLHPIIENKKDQTEFLNQKLLECKEVAFKLLSKHKNEILDSSLELLLWGYGNNEEIVSALVELDIIEKSAYNKYKILVTSENEIENNFSNVVAESDNPITYSQKIEHIKLNKIVEIIEESLSELNYEKERQILSWDFEWKLAEPEFELNSLNNLLTKSLDLVIEKENLLDKSSFTVEKPIQPELIEFTESEPAPPKGNFIFGLSKKAKDEYETTLKKWTSAKEKVVSENKRLKKEHENKINSWNNSFDEFIAKQVEHNENIERLFLLYEMNDEKGICNYFDFVLDNCCSNLFKKSRQIFFDKESKIISVNLELPTIEDLPKVKERTYIKSKSIFKEKLFTDKELKKIYEDAVYQIILSVVHLITKHDYKSYSQSVNLNGWVKSSNKGTGKYEVKFILSVLININEFKEVDLKLIDPKECFRYFKGISSSNLAELTPIKPILNISMTDTRFIDAVNVAENINENTNLASMDWEDFEYLIRELFEKEFITTGGEVKVTKASKDGGVDAIAFDKDPIKGGKIVIQAKRYTNIVGVSAVRDLLGTISHEGANKGILVTTSNFGADSYNFAKDKPITLLNGSELLYLLNKHGYKAKIDIEEAKRELEKNLYNKRSKI